MPCFVKLEAQRSSWYILLILLQALVLRYLQDLNG